MDERNGTRLALRFTRAGRPKRPRTKGDRAMKAWEHRLDRGLGYRGLFLIGSISWLADRLGSMPGSAVSTGGSRRPRVVVARASGPTGVTRDGRPEPRAA